MNNLESFSDFIMGKFNEYGDKPALQYNDLVLTYSDMIKKISLLSHSIKEARLISVAICMENRLNLIVFAVACMISGVPFIVIDRNNPVSFLTDILDEANVHMIISDGELTIENKITVELDDLRAGMNFPTVDSIISDDVLFYIATSGSTGKSKVAERLIDAFAQDYKEFENNYPFMFGEIAMQYAKLNFSYGLENTLLLLIGGTTICLPQSSISVQELGVMYEEINKCKASIVFWASPIIKLLSKHYKLFEGMPCCIRYIYTGGEPLVVSADLVVELRNRKMVLINDYGCSEIGKVFTYPFQIDLKDMEQFNMVGIGEPLKEYDAVILNADFEEVEEGFLVLKSSERFNCRYVNRNIKTCEVFKDGYWYYNMHDIAKKVDGNIIVLGREINSVNITGYRIELEQVEYFINQLEEINVCVAIAKYNQYREASLFCFYDGKLSEKELRLKLMDIVPGYMIPNVFIRVEKVYLLPNGKVDRKRNKEEFEHRMNTQFIDSREIKDRIYKYLVEIVGSSVGELDDIFARPFSEYGVDSLDVVDFLSTVEEREKVLITSDGIGTKIKSVKDVVDIVSNIKEWEGCMQNEDK